MPATTTTTRVNKHLIFFLFILALLPASENRRFVKITNLRCHSYDVSVAKFVKCLVKPISRDISEITVHTILPMKKLANVTVNVQLRKRGNARNPMVYNFSMDFCEMLDNRYKNNNYLANIFFQLFGFDRFSNVNHSCPDYDAIIIEKYRMDEQTFALIPFPYGEYTINVLWYFKKLLKIKNEIGLNYYDKSSYKRN